MRKKEKWEEGENKEWYPFFNAVKMHKQFSFPEKSAHSFIFLYILLIHEKRSNKRASSNSFSNFRASYNLFDTNVN